MAFELGITVPHIFKRNHSQYVPFSGVDIFIKPGFRLGRARISGRPLSFLPNMADAQEKRRRIQLSNNRKMAIIDIFVPCFVEPESMQYFKQCARDIFDQDEKRAEEFRFLPELILKITVSAAFRNSPVAASENIKPLPNAQNGHVNANEYFRATHLSSRGNVVYWPVRVSLLGRSLDNMALNFPNGSVSHVQARRNVSLENFQIYKSQQGYEFSCVRRSIISDMRSVSKPVPTNLRQKLSVTFGLAKVMPRTLSAEVFKVYKADAASASSLVAALA